ncbi:histidinol-phosphate transaminase [Flavobacterium sp.]|uniref:histidinol-phosphate transaminase n=1 Tax=Flavobacterium sp. TaxID=239 RepID=UPI0025B8FF55|nr:histidinol-phosphate transaminase [Flavobacterium sp.]MBA4154355.1 histidinol-phosphate transaminase [Flavobacterium sp.]
MQVFKLEPMIRKNVREMRSYSSARDEFTSTNQQLIFLDANENPFETGLNRYPDPKQLSLKQVLSKQKKVAETSILIGNGSDEVLDLILRAFCEPKEDNVITHPPTYGMYGVLSQLNAVENREVFLTADFQLDVDEILNQVTNQTKIIFLCSPNNPTGNSFSRASIEKIVKSFQGFVVIDEAYIDFSTQESWLTQLETYPNLIITQTLSKAYGLAGIRIGVLYASPAIISILNKIKPPYNINSLSQRQAILSLNQSDKLKNDLAALLGLRTILIEELSKLSFVVKVFATDANFILIRVDDANLRYQQLLSKGIVVRNRSNQPLCENCLRITIGTRKENEQLLTILKQL